VADDKPASEKAKELLIYGPVGLAMYVRDTAPSFLKLFVARGKAELGDKARSVNDQLDQAKAVGEFASSYGPAQAKTFLADGFAKVRARAEETLEALSALVPEPTGQGDTADAGASAAPTAGSMVDATTEVPSQAAVPDEVVRTREHVDADHALAIPDYDELSASQVIDRLEGLGQSELEAIRAYELEHRSRKTVLGKIYQLMH
jgi:hypothetical protein